MNNTTPTMAEVRKAVKAYEKLHKTKVDLEKSGTNSLTSNLFYGVSRQEAIDFFSGKISVNETSILKRDPDYATALYDNLGKYTSLRGTIRRVVEIYSEKIGCRPAVYDANGFIDWCDDETYFRNHDASILKDVIETEFLKAGFVISFK